MSVSPPVSTEGVLVVRAPTALERIALPSLVHTWLRPQAQWPARRELPFLLESDPRTIVRIASEEDELVAHAALHRREVRCAEARIPIGLIGAVATAPSARGRGHASRVLDSLISAAKEAGLALVALWDEHGGSLYERLGFREAGIEQLFVARREDFRARSSPCELVRLDPHLHLDGVSRLYAREPGGLLRSRSDWERLVWLPGTDFYVLTDRRTGTVIAYAVVGKGSDLQGCLHEWCGPELLLEPLLAEILARREEEALIVMSPPWRHGLKRIKPLQGHEIHRGALAQVMVLDPLALQHLMQPHRPHAFDGDAAIDPRNLFGWREESAHPYAGHGLYIFGLDSM